MAYIHELEHRVTRKYVDQHSNLDQWENSNLTIKVLGGKSFEPYYWARRIGDDPERLDHSDDGGRVFNFVLLRPTKVPKKAPGSVKRDTELEKFAFKLRRLVYDNFTYSGCSHEYDCCGCRSASLKSLTRVGRHEWRVELDYGRNY